MIILLLFLSHIKGYSPFFLVEIEDRDFQYPKLITIKLKCNKYLGISLIQELSTCYPISEIFFN